MAFLLPCDDEHSPGSFLKNFRIAFLKNSSEQSVLIFVHHRVFQHPFKNRTIFVANFCLFSSNSDKLVKSCCESTIRNRPESKHLLKINTNTNNVHELSKPCTDRKHASKTHGNQKARHVRNLSRISGQRTILPKRAFFGFSKRQENLKTPIFDPILRVLQKK